MSRPANLRAAAARVMLAAALGACAVRPAFADEAPSTITELARLPTRPPDFLVPSDPGLLFFIHVSVTPKTVVYAARFSRPGRLDKDQPVDVYWRRFNGDGGRSALTFVERKLAYGVQTQPSPGNDNAVFASIAGYPQRALRIDVDQDGRPEALMRMGDRQVRLIYVSVQIDSSALLPKVVAVDIHGVDTASGKILRERIEPVGGRSIQ